MENEEIRMVAVVVVRQGRRRWRSKSSVVVAVKNDDDESVWTTSQNRVEKTSTVTLLDLQQTPNFWKEWRLVLTRPSP